jgi:hypothetical protein
MLTAATAASVGIRLRLRPWQSERRHQYSEQQTGERTAHEHEDSTTSHCAVTMRVWQVKRLLQQILADVVEEVHPDRRQRNDRAGQYNAIVRCWTATGLALQPLFGEIVCAM